MTQPIRIRQCERLAARTIEGKGVVIVLDRQIVHTLNNVGMRIFDLADGRTSEEIADIISHEFDVSLDRAQEDVDRFINELLVLGAVDIVKEPPGT